MYCALLLASYFLLVSVSLSEWAGCFVVSVVSSSPNISVSASFLFSRLVQLVGMMLIIFLCLQICVWLLTVKCRDG